MEISVRNQQRKIEINLSLLRKVTRRTLEALGCSDAECSVLLVSDRRIQDLNHTYRKVAAATDVLAFPMREGPGGELYPTLLGDVVISAERARSQALKMGHSVMTEVSILLVHGLLHLMGWDDATEVSRKEMFAMQEKILKQVFPEGFEDA